MVPQDREIDPPVERALKLIGGELRRLRLKRGLTQSEMEDRGISYKYYQRIESGRANVTIRTLVRVMRALDLEFSHFFRSGEGGGKVSGAGVYRSKRRSMGDPGPQG